MKKSLLFISLVWFSLSALAQTPQGFKYQTVARNNVGEILASQNISFRMTILQGELPGTAVYTETHAVATNAVGLATLEIGRGTPVTGNFAPINWSLTPVFLKTEIDPAGGSAFVEMGTSELLSVPFAFEAKHARTLTLKDVKGNEYEITVDTLGNLNVSPILPIWQCGLPITDERDGQSYATVQIGTQCWMAENLNIGTRIAGTANAANNETIEKYCFGDDEANCDVYGGLYQWDEMMGYTTTAGVQGICPEGWHLPTDAEWTALTNYVSSQPVYLCNSIPGHIAKALAAKTNWNTSTVTCAVGNDLALNNATGFTVLPGGYRFTNGTIYNLGSMCHFWSSTEYSATDARNRNLIYNNAYVYGLYYVKGDGFSVRCLRD